MNHDRAGIAPSARRIGQVEPLGQVVIELESSYLPFALECVRYINLDFRSVERTFFGIKLEDEVVTPHRGGEFFFAHPPLLCSAEMLIGHRCQFELRLREAERRVNIAD